MGWPFSPRDFVLGVVTGLILTIVLIFIATFTLLRSSEIYGLGHWKLNIRTPLRSTWINLGYWKTNKGVPIEHFDEAARGLLIKLLESAGLLPKDEDDSRLPTISPEHDAVAILDLGFGCGDQTMALTELVRASSRSGFRYVGLTLNSAQMQTAQRRLDRAFALENDDICTHGLSRESFKLYRANAAKPDTWTHVIRSSVESLADKMYSERWLMALDCLYHFSPSRKPVFKFAAERLDANVVAFDLILNEKASWRDIITLRALGVVMGCPLYTFLTEEQYREQLVGCGYDKAQIEITDISDDVFAGVSGYLKRQDAALDQYGISLGGYKLAGRIFEWFDRTRVVKAAIVVGRTKRKA